MWWFLFITTLIYGLASIEYFVAVLDNKANATLCFLINVVIFIWGIYLIFKGL